MTNLLQQKFIELSCGICGKKFACSHDMQDTFQGQKLKVPHCFKCGWDEEKCKDKHGYMCESCQKIGGGAFKNRP